MKISHINGVYGISSTGRLIRDLVEQGQAQGIESRVYYSERHSDAPQAVRYITDGERNVHAVLSRLTGLQGYWSRGATRRLLAMLEEFDPDVVHLHVVHGNCLCLPMLFAWLQKRQPKVVITLHDCWWFTGRCAHPSAYDCDGYTGDCRHCPAGHDVCPSWFLDRADRMLADKRRWLPGLNDLHVAAVSDWVRGQAERSFLPRECLSRIYNWVDTQTFCPRPTAALRETLGLGGKKVVLGVATLLAPSKGLEDLLYLAQHLPADYQVILIGALPEGTQLPEDVIHIPRTDDADELACYYSLAEVFVNPSRFETFGLTTAEAMACGTPAVVYDVTACPELIGPGTGAAVPLPAGGKGLLKVVTDIQKERMTAASREWAQKNFARQQGTERYFALYRGTKG